jgi:hypothetical protein
MYISTLVVSDSVIMENSTSEFRPGVKEKALTLPSCGIKTWVSNIALRPCRHLVEELAPGFSPRADHPEYLAKVAARTVEPGLKVFNDPLSTEVRLTRSLTGSAE